MGKVAIKKLKNAPAKGMKGARTRRKKRTETYKTYIYKVLKQVHPDVGISKNAMEVMNNFIVDMFQRLSVEAGNIVAYNKRATLTSREVITAIRLVLPGELAKHAVSEGTKSVTRFTDIGTFDHHKNDTCGAELLNSFPLPSLNSHPLKKLNKIFNPFASFTKGTDALDLSLCKKVINYIDEMYEKESRPELEDFKLDVTEKKLKHLIGSAAFSKLKALYPGEIKQIKIRRCESHGKWIDFHHDVTNLTLQVSLNHDNEYVGGKLVYISEGKYVAPLRTAGSYTLHDDTILHGVSRLDQGIRYGLFFLGRRV
eukprot:g9090.t1